MNNAPKPSKKIAERAWNFVRDARVARLGTVNDDGTPHVVPIVFACTEDCLYFAVDSKPKKSKNLRRLRNLRRNKNATLLVDEYRENWSRLSFAIIYAKGRILGQPDRSEIVRAVRLLRKKYKQYRSGRYQLNSGAETIIVRLDPDRSVYWTPRP